MPAIEEIWEGLLSSKDPSEDAVSFLFFSLENL